MPVYNDKIGFIRREQGDTFGGLLVAPGGKVEHVDNEIIDNTPYFITEYCAVRELKEETNIEVDIKDLKYLCSLRLPHNNRVVISYYVYIATIPETKLEFYNEEEIKTRGDFAPGMKEEALLLLKKIKRIIK